MLKKQKDYVITTAKVLSRTELESTRRLCQRYLSIEREARNALIILLALECGLRASEVLGITVGDFDETEKTVFIRSLKGSMPRVLPIRKTLADSIRQMVLSKNPNVCELSMVDKDCKVFDIGYNRLEQVWRMMRPSPNKTFHSLRHTFAVQTYLRTRDIKLVQTALGHKNIDNTMVYVNFVYANSSLRKALVVGE